MVITELLARNAALYGDEVCLVCVNPEVKEKREVTWREYELMETNAHEYSRREITWRLFDEGANRFAESAPEQGYRQGRQGGDPPHELPGVAPDLLRDPQDRGGGGADELSLHRGGDRVLSQALRDARARFRARVRGPGGDGDRPDARPRPPLLRGRGLPLVRRVLQRGDARVLRRSRRRSRSPSRTTGRSTSPPAPPASPRRYCTITAA